MDKGIGEEIKNNGFKDHFGKVLGRFEVGTTPMDFICSRIKVVLLAFAVIAVIFIIVMLPVGILGSPLLLLAFLTISFLAFVITFLITVGMMFAMLYPLGDKVLKENWTKVTEKGILNQHKLWITTGPMRNFIPFENVTRVEPIDETYMEERKRRTKLWYRMMVLHPEPPPGGLYHYYSDPKGLIILHLNEPILIHNLGFFGKFSWWPLAVDKVVSEVILDIDPVSHKGFLKIIDSKINRPQ